MKLRLCILMLAMLGCYPLVVSAALVEDGILVDQFSEEDSFEDARDYSSDDDSSSEELAPRTSPALANAKNVILISDKVKKAFSTSVPAGDAPLASSSNSAPNLNANAAPSVAPQQSWWDWAASYNPVNVVKQNIKDVKQDALADVEKLKKELVKDISNERRAIFSDVQKTVFITAAVILGSIALYQGSKILYNKYKKYKNRPKLTYKLWKSDEVRPFLYTSFKDWVSDEDTRSIADTLMGITSLNKSNIQKGLALNAEYKSVILYGDPGCGKRSLVHHLAKEADMDLYELSGSELRQTDAIAAVALQDLFDRAAKSSQGAIIHISDGGMLLPMPRKDSAHEPLSILVNTFTKNIQSGRKKVLVIVSVPLESAIDQEVAKHFDIRITVSKPALAERIQVIQKICKDKILLKGVPLNFAHSVQEQFSEEKVKAIAELFDGATVADLVHFAEILREAGLASPSGIVNEELVMQIVLNSIKRKI